MTQSHPTLSRLWPWCMCLLGMVFYCYEYMLRVGPSVIVMPLMHAFDINATQYGVLSAFYFWAYTPMQLLVGALMDRHGVRKLLTLAIAFCAIGSLLFGLATHLWIAQIARFLIGFGSAFAFVGVLKLGADWLPENVLAFLSGLTTAFGMLGAISGEVALTHLLHTVDWRVASFGAAAFGMLLTLLAWFIIRDFKTPVAFHLDRQELRDVFADLLKIIRIPRMWIVGVIGGLLYMPMTLMGVVMGVYYLEQAHHVAPQVAANINSLIFLGWAIGSPTIGIVSELIGSRRIPLVVGACLATVILTYVIYAPNISLFQLKIALLAFGLACSPQILVFPIACERAPRHFSGTAVAVTNMFVMLGGALIPPLIGALLDLNWDGHFVRGIAYYSVTDYRLAFSVLPIGLLICFVLTFFVPETHCHHQVD